MKQLDFQKIKKFREEAHMTQEALATAMSLPNDRIHVQQISEWENRTRGGINTSTLLRLAHALNKPMEAFFIDPPDGAA